MTELVGARSAARILVVDGCPAETTERTVELGGRPYGEAYAAALSAAMPDKTFEYHILSIADGESLPQGVAIADFAGVAWTGSPLSAYDEVPAVTRQIELARDVYRSGVPAFGSCWGLQIMCKALGGEVRANPKGYEIGVARNISLTPEGRDHPMYAGKPSAFDALALHRDEVSAIPAGGRVLATNAMSDIQALQVESGKSSFWGVQYHPEFDLGTIALLYRRNAAQLVRDGFVSQAGDASEIAAAMSSLHADPARKDLAWRYGVGQTILNASVHKLELSRWLAKKVVPRASSA